MKRRQDTRPTAAAAKAELERGFAVAVPFLHQMCTLDTVSSANPQPKGGYGRHPSRNRREITSTVEGKDKSGLRRFSHGIMLTIASLLWHASFVIVHKEVVGGGFRVFFHQDVKCLFIFLSFLMFRLAGNK